MQSQDKNATARPLEPVKTIVERFAELVQKPSLMELGPEHKIALLPAGMTIEGLEDYLPPPQRIKQAVELLNVESFLAYVNRFMGPPTTIFANETNATYEAVIDYHPDQAVLEAAKLASGYGNQDHIARYACPKSEQWNTWNGGTTQQWEQVEFATFLENNLPDIIDPPGAAFLEIALQLKIHKSADFASDVRLSDGQTKFRYEEIIKGSTKAGDIEIPQAFTIAIPVFVDGPKYKITARFKYRLNGSKLVLGYDLVRSREIWQAAVKEVTARIAAGTPAQLHAGKRA